jgi:hypothetical protein
MATALAQLAEEHAPPYPTCSRAHTAAIAVAAGLFSFVVEVGGGEYQPEATSVHQRTLCLHRCEGKRSCLGRMDNAGVPAAPMFQTWLNA